MQLLRRIFFYIFAAIYIILCPLILLYAFGYIYRPGAEESVVQTGVIYLSTAPTGAAIYLKDSQYAENTPTVVRGLVPGDYPVKLTLDDHKPWSQTVPVEVEKATVLDKILLLPLQWKTSTLLPDRIQDLLPVPGSGFFLAAGGPAAGDILVYDYNNEKAHALFEKDSPFAGAELASYFTVRESCVVILRLASRGGERFLWVELGEDKDAVEDITGLFPVVPSAVKWLPGQEKTLFAFQEDYLSRVEVDSGAVYPRCVPNVRGYGLLNGEVYVLHGDNIFLKMSYDTKSKKVLMDDQALGASIFGQKGFFHVRVLSEDYMLFLGEDGKLLANRLPYRFIEKGVRGVEFDPKLERALVWQKDRIGILDFSTEETQDVQFEKGPTLSWAYREGKDIEQCFWVYEGSHILFRDGNDVFLIEIEEYGEFTLDHLFHVKDKSAVYYAEQTGKMYFLEPGTENLLSVEIVPSKGMVPTPFPAATEENKTEQTGGS